MVFAQESKPQDSGLQDVGLLGGTDPSRFDAKEAWYPVFFLRDLERTTPNAFTLLGIDLVIWWDQATDRWQAMRDQCPHRLVPLSEGRIAEDGLLECPYHGWAFTGDGKCDRIPQQNEGDQANQAARACIPVFATAESQGLLFVYGGDAAIASQVPIPTIAPYDSTDPAWICMTISRDLPYDAVTLMENVLDASHLPFTHHKSVGNRVNAAPMDLELVNVGRNGFVGHWAEGPRKGKLGAQDTTFVAPNLMWHDLTSKTFGRTITAVYATPTRKGECRLFAMFPFQFSSPIPQFFIKWTPNWYSHINQNSILEDDQIFLHWQERALNQAGGSDRFSQAFYLPTKADRFVFEFRQWFSTFGADPFPNQPLPIRQSREALLDRYHSHTKHCKSCRTALKNIVILQRVMAALGAIALVSATVIPTMGIAALAIGLVWYKLNDFKEGYYRGPAIPARNRN